MSLSNPEPPTIDYATPVARAKSNFLEKMFWWRAMCAVASVIFVVTICAGETLSVHPILASIVMAGSFGAACSCAVMTIIYLGLAALQEVGPGYAVRQVLLAVAMSLFFFCGVWIVPSLVQSDLLKWRDTDDSAKTGTMFPKHKGSIR